MKINEKYQVLVSETESGEKEFMELELTAIQEFEGKEVYVFVNEFGDTYFDYKKEEGEEMDWNFIENIYYNI